MRSLYEITGSPWAVRAQVHLLLAASAATPSYALAVRDEGPNDALLQLACDAGQLRLVIEDLDAPLITQVTLPPTTDAATLVAVWEAVVAGHPDLSGVRRAQALAEALLAGAPLAAALACLGAAVSATLETTPVGGSRLRLVAPGRRVPWLTLWRAADGQGVTLTATYPRPTAALSQTVADELQAQAPRLRVAPVITWRALSEVVLPPGLLAAAPDALPRALQDHALAAVALPDGGYRAWLAQPELLWLRRDVATPSA